MARGQLQSVINNAQRVHDMLKDNDNLPEWVQSKITLAEDYISTVANYMMSEIDEAVKEVGDDPTGSSAQETLVKKGGKTTVAKPIAEASSVAVRMQRALDRIKAKREASEQRGREVLQPKKPEPVKEDVEQLDELSPNALGDYMKAGHKKYDSIRNNTDSASMAKKSKLETGAVFAPYIPLIMTPLVYDPETFVPRKGLLTRYAKKMVRPEFYGKIYVSGLNTL